MSVQETTDANSQRHKRVSPLVPLYVDSLPAQLTHALEEISLRRVGRGWATSPGIVAIVNNGFHEAGQNAVALRICRRFAAEAGFEWAGGLALGGGEAINGRPLSELRGVAPRL